MDVTATRQRTRGGEPAPTIAPTEPAAPSPAAPSPAAARGLGAVGAVGVETGPWLEEHRRELTGHCRRILGSATEAEDAVQETLVRAWRAYDRFEGRAALRSWLRRIATNVCIDMMRWPQRRAHPMDLGPGAGDAISASLRPGGGRGRPRRLGEPGGVGTAAAPLLDGGHGGDDPAERVAVAERVRGAFVTALRCLPPRQRAVLILREVLRWRADEVAELLGTTTASVNSALQRARATLAARGVTGEAPAGDPGTAPEAALEAETLDGPERELLARYVEAFGRFDVESLVALLQADASGTAAARRPRGAAEHPHPGAATAARHPLTVDPGRYRYCA